MKKKKMKNDVPEWVKKLPQTEYNLEILKQIENIHIWYRVVTEAHEFLSGFNDSHDTAIMFLCSDLSMHRNNLIKKLCPH